MPALLEMRDINKAFFGVPVLKNVRLDLHHGEVHAFLGANGAGKSTLIKILSGAYTLDSGVIEIDGKPIDTADYSPQSAIAQGIATIYQNFHLVPHLTVAENVCLEEMASATHPWVDWASMDKQALAVMATVGLKVHPRTKVKNLTVSQQQLLEIATAIGRKARILIMDEPTAAISRREVENLFNLVRDIQKQGVGVIYISHRLEEIQQIANRVTVLRDGMNVGTLPVDENLDIQRVVELITGKEIRTGRRARVTVPSGDFVDVRGVLAPGFPEPISFSIRKGEILGITGLVGAGKTEFARALFGADRAVAGTFSVNGKQVDNSEPTRSISYGVGYLPEDRDGSGLCLSQSLADNISLVSKTRSSRGVFSVSDERKLSNRFFRDLSIKAIGLDQQVKYLSGGNKQKVIFAKWLAAECQFLILDEPTIGIDVGAREELYRLTEDFVRSGRSVLMISSDIEEIMSCADRILVMAHGRIVTEIDPEKSSKTDIMSWCLGLDPKTTSSIRRPVGAGKN